MFKILFCFIILCFSIFPAFASEGDYDSVIVLPKENVSKVRRINKLLYRHGIYRYRKVKEDVYVIPLDKEDDKELRIKELKESGLFELVEPDYKLYLDKVSSGKRKKRSKRGRGIKPNDKGFYFQYYLNEIKATKAWRKTVGDALLIGVLDTGVDAYHPDLEGKVIDDENNIDEIGHGTEVSGIIAAKTNNIEGIAGIAWNAKILSLKITNEEGVASVSTVVSALDKAYRNGVKIVQVSLSANIRSKILKGAIQEAQERGILIISSGGNTGVNELRYPAAYSGVIGVGAISQDKDIEAYSTRGEHISLVAPGSFIYTTSNDSGYTEVTGSSFAAPQVTGAAALVWSVAPNLTNKEVREILINSAEDLGQAGRDNEYGYGLLNVEKAVELAKAGL